MAVNSAKVTLSVTANEQIDDNAPAVLSTAQVAHDQYKTSATLSSSTTPAITEVVSVLVTLSGGAATVDFTSLTKAGGGSLDTTGLKLQAAYFEVPGSSSMTISDGATNGYNIFGDASGQVTIPGTGSLGFYFPEGLDDVATADATIDFAGTGTDTCKCVFLFG